MRRGRRAALIGLLIVGAVVGVGWYCCRHRPLPSSATQRLFQGVTYSREVRGQPRPLVIHVVRIEHTSPGIEFVVTPGDPGLGLPLTARTTSQFLEEFNVQVAVNGDFFSPWRSNFPWDYYPHRGDRVDAQGFAASEGVIYSGSPEGRRYPTLFLAPDNQAGIGSPVKEIFNVLSGDRRLVRDGRAIGFSSAAAEPRTAVGITRDGEALVILVVDGRQPNYSEGVTLSELSELAVEYGCHDAINLDGGGSSTLVVEGKGGRPQRLNSPIDNRIPGRERPVANHLGIRALSLP